MNWRDEAMAGRGLFTREQALEFLGAKTEIDFYSRTNGDKRPGKLSQVTGTGYTVVDLLTFERQTFTFAGRAPISKTEKAAVVKTLINQGRIRRDLSKDSERRTMEVLEAILLDYQRDER